MFPLVRLKVLTDDMEMDRSEVVGLWHYTVKLTDSIFAYI